MIYVWCEVVCLECASTCSGRHVSTSRIPRRDMMAEAKAIGWTFDKAGEAHCGCEPRDYVSRLTE